MQSKVAFIGTALECRSLLSCLANTPVFRAVGLWPVDEFPVPVKRLCAHSHISIAGSYEQLLSLAPEIVFVCTTSHLEIPLVPQASRPEIISYQTACALSRLLSETNGQLANSEERREKYLSALNAASEGIQIMNDQGIIEYVNPAFSKITGIHPSERIGTSIYAVSPDGAGAQALKSGKSAIGVRNQAVGSCSEVISNGSPIMINNKLRGSVVLFQEVTDIIRLSQELNKSRVLIESLSAELNYTKSCKYSFEDLVGSNKKLLEAVNLAKRAAKNDSTVLITGESGTGKEILANAIHQASPRWKKPFITVNCASIPDSLIESELFGHEKGAFTGADKTKAGKFELANGGTIFLDEIGDLNFTVQAKLLRVLQEKEVERVGGSERLPIDVKILAATNKNLFEMVKKGSFREDLYYRLQVIAITIPPLRERKDDLLPLIEHLIRKICQSSNIPIPYLPPKSFELLQAYQWPGNIRELGNCLTRAILISDGKTLQPNNFHFLLHTPLPDSSSVEEQVIPLNEMEKILLTRALKQYGSSTVGKKAAAKALQISLGTLYYKIKQYKLDD